MAKIVSIHSYRGGTGKSNLTANLAACLAAAGKRVAVVDTDLQSPGIHMLFGLEDTSERHTLNDYLWERCRVGEAAVDVTPERIGRPGGRIRLVPSSLNATEIAKVLREGYNVGLMNDAFLQALIDEFVLDYLLIDTHPGLNEETLLSIAISYVLVVLLRPDRSRTFKEQPLPWKSPEARGPSARHGAQQGDAERDRARVRRRSHSRVWSTGDRHSSRGARDAGTWESRTLYAAVSRSSAVGGDSSGCCSPRVKIRNCVSVLQSRRAGQGVITKYRSRSGEQWPRQS